MDFLTDLWLPIVLSAVFVFVVSSVIHMGVQYHKSDHKKLPGEDGVMEAIRKAGVPPGSYLFPCAGSMKEMQSPEMLERFRLGPVGWITLVPNGHHEMGKALAQWFVFSLVVSALAGYLAHATLPPGADYLAVFRVTGTAATMAYALDHVTESIWKGQSWTVTAKFGLDGVAYGRVTAGAFGWLWPAGI
jgi:hypothetical protein